jgi:hypothetical protein
VGSLIAFSITGDSSPAAHPFAADPPPGLPRARRASRATIDDVTHARETLLGDLPGTLVASFAEMSFIVAGRTRWTAALLHRALELEPWDVTALATLSGFLDDALGKLPAEFRILSAVVLEHALSPESPLGPEQRAPLDHARFLMMWVYKFSRRVDGKTELKGEEFRDRASFLVDHEAYARWWHGGVEAAGSFDAAFRVAASVPGFLAGFLKRRDANRQASVCAAYRPEDLLVDGEAYDEWLTQPVEALERLRATFDSYKKRT